MPVIEFSHLKFPALQEGALPTRLISRLSSIDLAEFDFLVHHLLTKSPHIPAIEIGERKHFCALMSWHEIRHRAILGVPYAALHPIRRGAESEGEAGFAAVTQMLFHDRAEN